MKLHCPHCGKPLDLVEQIAEWEAEFGEEVSEEAMVNIFCSECENGGFVINFVAYDEVEDMYADNLEESITLPKIRDKLVN
jgi:hypothetical protein